MLHGNNHASGLFGVSCQKTGPIKSQKVCSCQSSLGSQYSISSGSTKIHVVTGLYFTYPRDRQAAQRAADNVAAQQLTSSFPPHLDSDSLREPSTSLVSVCLLSNKCLLWSCPLQDLLPPSDFSNPLQKGTTSHAEGQQNLQAIAVLALDTRKAGTAAKACMRKIKLQVVAQVTGHGKARRRQERTCQEQLKSHSSKISQ